MFEAAALVSAFFSFFALAIYGAYRWQPDHFREPWNDYMEPFRFVIGPFI